MALALWRRPPAPAIAATSPPPRWRRLRRRGGLARLRRPGELTRATLRLALGGGLVAAGWLAASGPAQQHFALWWQAFGARGPAALAPPLTWVTQQHRPASNVAPPVAAAPPAAISIPAGAPLAAGQAVSSPAATPAEPAGSAAPPPAMADTPEAEPASAALPEGQTAATPSAPAAVPVATSRPPSPPVAAPVATPRPPSPPTPAAAAGTHIVARGETLSSIAARYGTSVSALARLNHLDDPDKITEGDRLAIPR